MPTVAAPDDRIHTREVAMYFPSGKKSLIGVLSLALAVLTMTPTPASAGPEPGAKRPNGKYRLFAGNLGAITINQVVYGFATTGEVGLDSTGSSTVGGGFWPKGTGNQYMFNSGLQVAGVIQGNLASNPWAGDTTGGMFFDGSGLRLHGTPITELRNATSLGDVAVWPQAAFVPKGDFSEDIFDPLLRGRISASQGDVWFMTKETDPSLSSGRDHPLGIVAEYRTLGWNFPSGNEDLIYLVVTFYNVTTTNPAAYAQYRPGLREILIQEAQLFQTQNNAAFNVSLPADGYTIDPFFAAFAADPDVTNSAAVNFASVNLPFAMGYSYHADFPRAAGWTFSPTVFGAPFFPGAGFVGMKYLKSAAGPGEIKLFSVVTNGGPFPDPSTTVRLFKYLSGTVTPADGVACNQGDVELNSMCFVENTAPRDVRIVQSSPALALGPGEAGSIVVAYVHAAPVQIPGYVGGTRVFPGDPTLLRNAALLPLGANRIDSLSGFRGFTDANADGIVQQEEIRTVRGSLLGKALVAQSIFDSKFLLPFAPDAPEFFLIPSNQQVTVIWRPSAAESTGDPFFEIASQVTVVPEGGGAPLPNPLYDPNYRNFDVEGYRVYRGRADTPNSLRLLAQYDYAGTTFLDFRGQVVAEAVGNRCAPELGVTGTCAGFFSPVIDGQAATLSRPYNIVSPFVQVGFGSRDILASGTIINIETDTLVTGQASGFPDLENNGVPFVFIDNEVRNGLTYFYAVTAFDVNSITSTGRGNTSLESARITKRVVPNTIASNFSSQGTVGEQVVWGRTPRTDKVLPVLDPATGKFNKPFPIAEGTNAGIATFVSQVVANGMGQATLTFDSVTIGGSVENASQNVVHHFTANGTQVQAPITMELTSARQNANQNRTATGSFPAVPADPTLAMKFGGGPGFSVAGSYSVTVPSGYYLGVKSRGCVNGASSLSATSGLRNLFWGSGTGGCYFNGPRWFVGDNETKDHPNEGNSGRFTFGTPTTNFNNSGELPGVVTIHRPVAYNDRPANWRRVEGAFSAFIAAADYKVYWGAAGTIDSVIDIVHDVPIPFKPTFGSSWGILNASAVPAGQSFDLRPELSISDIGCVAPLRTHADVQGIIPCTGNAATLSATATPGPVVLVDAFTNNNLDRTGPVAANNGFGLYLMGEFFLIELQGGVLPTAGTVWTMRDYIGAIRGGVGTAGNFGDYVYTKTETVGGAAETIDAIFQLVSPGASLRFNFEVNNQVTASTKETLKKIHTVPDPYYVTSAFEATTTNKIIKFVNLPEKATIRIYTVSGVLVRVLKQDTGSFSGELTWDVRNRNNQFVASGVYFYHVTAENGETTVGRMTIVNFAT
ncbi:MAG: T9SS type A sorting domain-containing protein [Gemmatimonadales bacterium]|nr:T9SS type A sorting domain-containing protein [Gemmatimonadales bacterium]